MKKRIPKIIAWIAALSLILGLGAVVGGGIVYATTRDKDSISFTFRSDGEEPFPPEPGVVIAAVLPDGPADAAGVARGDILLQLDGQAVNDMLELMRVLGEHEIGDEVELTVLHGDDERTLAATLGDRDDVAYLGVVPCAGIPVPEWRMPMHITEVGAEPGATIIDVAPDTPADWAGLQVGDVIVAVDGQELDAENNLADLIAVHKPGDSVTLEIEQPDKESRRVRVELGEHPDEEGIAYLGVQYRPARHLHMLEGEDFSFERHGGPFHREEEELFFHIVPGNEWDHEMPFPLELSVHVVPHVDLEGLEGEIVQGATVQDVIEDSPAEAAGLRQGDLITVIEGDPLESASDLADAIAERQPGDRVTLTVSHLDGDEGENEEREIKITLAEHPDEEGVAYLGVRIGGFMHIQSFTGDGEHHELDLFINPKAPFDGQHNFEFHSPPEHLDGDDVDCCGRSI